MILRTYYIEDILIKYLLEIFFLIMTKKQLYIKTIMNVMEDSSLAEELKKESSYNKNNQDKVYLDEIFSQLISSTFPKSTGNYNIHNE